MSTKDFLTKNPLPATHKPFAELPGLPTLVKEAGGGSTENKPTKKGRIVHRSPKPTVEAIYIKKLVEALGTATKAADALHLTSSTIRMGLNTGKSTNTVEGHAKAYYQANFEKPEPMAKDGQVFVSMLLPQDAFIAIKGWLAEAGAVVKVFK